MVLYFLDNGCICMEFYEIEFKCYIGNGIIIWYSDFFFLYKKKFYYDYVVDE